MVSGDGAAEAFRVRGTVGLCWWVMMPEVWLGSGERGALSWRMLEMALSRILCQEQREAGAGC